MQVCFGGGCEGEGRTREDTRHRQPKDVPGARNGARSDSFFKCGGTLQGKADV